MRSHFSPPGCPACGLRHTSLRSCLSAGLICLFALAAKSSTTHTEAGRLRATSPQTQVLAVEGGARRQEPLEGMVPKYGSSAALHAVLAPTLRPDGPARAQPLCGQVEILHCLAPLCCGPEGRVGRAGPPGHHRAASYLLPVHGAGRGHRQRIRRLERWTALRSRLGA